MVRAGFRAFCMATFFMDRLITLVNINSSLHIAKIAPFHVLAFRHVEKNLGTLPRGFVTQAKYEEKKVSKLAKNDQIAQDGRLTTTNTDA